MVDEPTNAINKETTSGDSEIVQENNENPIPEENPSPTSPPTVAESYGEAKQESTTPALENTVDLGEPRPSVPVEELGADEGDLRGVGYDNIPPPEDSTPSEFEKTQENQAQNEPVAELQREADQLLETAPEPETPQIPVNEALPESEPSISEAKQEPKPTATPEPELKPQTTEATPPVATSPSFALALLVKARNAIQSRKRRKLDRIMSLFLKKSSPSAQGYGGTRKITNDEVEKFLHVSDATATRYLSQLEKEGKIKQNGKTGKSVFYIKI